jgi:2-phosphosulfolactate phosphatase
MTAGTPSRASQSGFEVRLSWGPSGIDALRGQVAVIVLVDLLRFTTALDVATASGASVRPVHWPFDGALQPDDVEVADGTGPRDLSLSPGSLEGLCPRDGIVLPSADGSHCSSLAATTGALVVAASLRNEVSVAAYVGVAARHEAVGIVPWGESWPDGTFRPAVEDLIGAGAVTAALAPDRSCSSTGRAGCVLRLLGGSDGGTDRVGLGARAPHQGPLRRRGLGGGTRRELLRARVGRRRRLPRRCLTD